MRKLLLISGLILWSGTFTQAQQVKDPVRKRRVPKELRSTTPEPPLILPKADTLYMRDQATFYKPWRGKQGTHDTTGRAFLIRTLTHANFQPNAVLMASHRAQYNGGREPENSMEAIRALFNPINIVDIVELDIKKSKDDSVYVMHDNYLQRTTDFLDKFPGIGTGQDAYGHYNNYTWAQVKTLTLKRPDFTYTDRTVPLFREVLRYIKNETPSLINLDIGDTAVFRAAWNVVKEEDAFDICIFKTAQFTVQLFITSYYTPLTPAQRAKVMFFPMITPTPPGGLTARAYYDMWENTQHPKGYEMGYRKNMPDNQEEQMLDIVDAIHQRNRVRVHVFNTLPDIYNGRYRGNVNIDQCCNEAYDSRGDWEYLFHPRPNTRGANGYVITDDPVMLQEYLGQ